MKKLLFILLILISVKCFAREPIDTTFHNIITSRFIYSTKDTSLYIWLGSKWDTLKLAQPRDTVKITDFVTKYQALQFKLKSDSIIKSGFVPVWRLAHKIDSIMALVKYRNDSVLMSGYLSIYMDRLNRKSNNHDSLFYLDERRYQSLTDTLTWGLGLSQLGHIVKVDTSNAQILSRLRASHEYAPLSHSQSISTITGLADSLLARYTKTQSDAKFALINHNQAQSTITALADSLLARYTKTQADARFAPISHNQAQSTITALSDSLLARYTKTQTNALLAAKKDKSDTTNTDGYTRRDRLSTELFKKVDKEAGKHLPDNNFTDSDSTALANLSASLAAKVNLADSIGGGAGKYATGKALSTHAALAATTSTSGHLSSTDWNTFNEKAPASGSGNYIWNQNNVEQSANLKISGNISAGLNSGIGVPGAGDTRLTVKGETTDDTKYILVGKDASGSNKFLLRNDGVATFSSTVTASNGVLVGGTLTPNYIPMAIGAGTLGNSGIYHNGNQIVIDDPTVSSSNQILTLQSSHTSQLTKGVIGFTSSVFSIQAKNISESAYQNLSLQPNGGSVGVGYNDPESYKLKVNGDGYFNGNLLINAGDISIIRDGDYIMVKQSSAGTAQYQTWYTSAGVRRGYFGFPSASNDFIELNNETGGNIQLTTSGSGKINIPSLTASKLVFTDASKNLTSTGIGTSSQLITGDGGLLATSTFQAAGTYSTDIHSNITALNAVSGTNSGDNAVNSLYSGLVTNATHTGDVTGSGALTIATNAVTLAKMQQVGTSTFLGRITAATGNVESLSIANAQSMLGLGSAAYTASSAYDPAGTGHTEASSHVSSHESTYNHSNYNTAYSWGDWHHTTLAGYGITDAVGSSDSRLTDARTPTSHTHGNITNTGAIGSTASLPIITTTSGVLTTGAFGTSAGQFAAGNHVHALNDLSDLSVGGATNGQVLSYSSGVWVPDTPSSMTYPTAGKVATSASGSSWDNTVSTSTLMLNNQNNSTGTYTITSGNFILSSDSTLKRNISKLTQLDYMKSRDIDFHKFIVKADTTNQLRYGVIAQEVQKVMPSVVYTNPETGKLAVAYIDMLIAIVAQQRDQIDNLEKRVSKLERKEKWRARR